MGSCEILNPTATRNEQSRCRIGRSANEVPMKQKDTHRMKMAAKAKTTTKKRTRRKKQGDLSD